MFKFFSIFGKFSAIISLNKLSNSFSLWDSSNSYIILFGGISLRLSSLLFFLFALWIISFQLICLLVHHFSLLLVQVWCLSYWILRFSHCILQIQTFCLVLFQYLFVELPILFLNCFPNIFKLFFSVLTALLAPVKQLFWIICWPVSGYLFLWGHFPEVYCIPSVETCFPQTMWFL